MSGYAVAPLFALRATGVPFEHLERVGTTETSALARHLLVRRSELANARMRAEEFVGSRASGLSADESRAYRKLIHGGGAHNGATPVVISRVADAVAAVADLEAELDSTLQMELATARASLFESSASVLPGYLVFGAGEFRDRLPMAGEALPPRNARARERERHLLLYLQRVCAKNDTYGEFGPSAWGTIAGEARFALQPGTAARESFLERWTAHTFAAAVNQDPEARAELAPRLNPNGRLEADHFLLLDGGDAVPLNADEVALLLRCDGCVPAHALGAPAGMLEELAERRVIFWRMETPAMEPHAFALLARDIAQWSDTPVRARWLERAQAILSLGDHFAGTADLERRAAMMTEARDRLRELGGDAARAQRFLYTAANPIAEECARTGTFSVSQSMADDLTRDIAPWLDLWRDTYAFVASRVAGALRGLLRSAAMENGAIALPAFLHHCAGKGLPLTGPGMVAPAHIAFQEVKAAFRRNAAEHAGEAEWELTAADCAFVREQFEFQPFDEYTYPAADLQISATSFEALASGDYCWVVSELHPPVALLHHAFYWSCPDKPAFARYLAQTVFGRPQFHFGFFAADFTAHTTVRLFDALPDLVTFVAPERGNSHWRTVSPAEAEVFVDESNGDVAVRIRGSHEYLGSFARSWLIPVGMHPFNFGGLPHMPRLRCGKAIVQRRTWLVTEEEVQPNESTVPASLVLAIEALRQDRGLPRYVYIRPSEAALRRTGAEGRDKDTKPVFLDLESYLSLEIFQRWLRKAGELEITEMLPDPDHLCWREADGRRTFELRALIVPRHPSDCA